MLQKSQRPSLYTYFEPVPEISGWYDASVLLDIWGSAWSNAGWRPVVLGRSVAETHPNWCCFSETVSAFPTKNSLGFDAACFHRWLAMAVIGGGLLVDIDVLPGPQMTLRRVKPPSSPTKLVIHSIDFLEHNRACPCIVQGSARAYEAACEAFLVAGRALKETVSHVSDQELLRAGCVEFEIRADVPTFGASGWESAFAIHYKTDSLKGLKGTKSERIAAAAPTLPQTSRAPGGYDLNHEIEQNRAHGPNVKPCVCVFSGSAPPRQLREIRHPLVPSDNFN